MTPVLRRTIPRIARFEWNRLKRAGSFRAEASEVVRERLSTRQRPGFEHEWVAHQSPLRRPGAAEGVLLQLGKEHNVKRAVELLDGAVLRPGQVFSYHHLVGRPSLFRGFVAGPELHDGRVRAGVGGGCCQVANLLFWLALHAGFEIVERHRHSLDLYPDKDRTVPFGCGATVFYNRADLRFRNVHARPLLLDLRIRDGVLRGSIRGETRIVGRYAVEERRHRFRREGDSIYRSNEIHRGHIVEDDATQNTQLLFRNRARVCYPVDENND